MKLKWCCERVARVLMVAAVGSGLTVAAKAQTVLVDFGTDSSFRGVSTTNPDSNGNSWNNLAPGTPGINLIQTSGSPTSLDLYFDTGVGTDSYNGPAGETTFPDPTPAEIAATDIDAAALGILGIKTAAMDFAASPEGPNKITRFQIQELDLTKKYNFTFFGSHKFSDNDTTIYSIFTDSTYSTLVGTESLDVQTPGMPWLHNRDTVAKINGLSPAANSILYVQFVGALGGTGYLNDFSITAVPEPSSILLVLSGIGMVFGYRRRSEI